jgi:hypothetical protein
MFRGAHNVNGTSSSHSCIRAHLELQGDGTAQVDSGPITHGILWSSDDRHGPRLRTVPGSMPRSRANSPGGIGVGLRQESVQLGDQFFGLGLS